MARPTPLLLGIDVGTSRTKALLVDPGGQEVAAAVVTTPFTRHGDHIEMGVNHLRSALTRVLDQLGEERGRVVAAGLTGMAESGAPLAADARPLAPVIAWHDPRGAEAVQTLEERFGDELARAIGQPIRTVSSVAKLGWLVGQGVVPAHWLGVPELGLHLLTGARATDYSLAARTGAYDVDRRQWIDDVPAALGFPVEVFAPVRAAGTVMGRVHPPGATWSGLPVGIPVTLAGHDHLGALAGSGARPDDLANSVGTAESVVARSGQLPDRQRALGLRVAITLTPDGDGWAVMAGAARAGTALLAAARALGLSPTELDRRAAGSESPARPGLLAAVLGGDITGLATGDPGDHWRSLLGALSERTWEAVGRARELLESRPPRLVVFGGGAASAPWLAIKAAAGDVPLWRATTREAAARGAALTAGVAAGWWPSTGKAPAAPLEPVTT